MLQDLIYSAKSDILQVYDNLKLPSAKLELGDEEFIFLEDIKLHSKNEAHANDPYNFYLNSTFDQEKNTITFYLPDNQPNGASAKFYAQASAYQERSPGGERFKSDDLEIYGYVKNASVTIDMGFYKQIGQKHMDVLKKVNKNA
jgi:hypothetical protein